jgi:2-isopropylmalate synthase
MPTATVRLRGPDGRVRTHAAVGTGPVDAAYKAIDALVQAPAELLEFSVRSVTEGIDALGEVTVRVRALVEGGALSPQHEVATTPVFHGNASDTDIIVASAKAYLKALARMLVALGHAQRLREQAAHVGLHAAPASVPPPAQAPMVTAVQEDRA